MARQAKAAKTPESAADGSGNEHLRWLVRGRSRNQKATLDLYLIIKNPASSIDRNIAHAQIAQELAAIAFSLWRAVFLSDLTEDVERQMGDVRSFLQTLISHNAINYPQDHTYREWTFQYYLNNARERLLNIARQGLPGILNVS